MGTVKELENKYPGKNAGEISGKLRKSNYEGNPNEIPMELWRNLEEITGEALKKFPE